MQGQWEQVVKLVFKGQRFQGHALDQDALAEVSHFLKMITETAKAVWRAENPARKNLPPHFEDRTRLCLRRIEEGSTAVPLEVFLEEPEQKEMFEPEPTEVRTAIRLARDVYRAVETDAPLPEGFPRTLVPEYERWGETLREDEAIEVLEESAEPVRVTRLVRRRLASFVEPCHEDQVEVAGEVLEADIRRQHFEIFLDQTTSVKVAFTPEQEDEVTTALRDHKTLRLQVKGRGQSTPQGKLVRVTQVHELRLQPVGDIPYDTAAPPIEEVLTDLAREIPQEECERLPADLAENIDHYVYGTPKR
jgi:hypothetical protein